MRKKIKIKIRIRIKNKIQTYMLMTVNLKILWGLFLGYYFYRDICKDKKRKKNIIYLS